MLDLYGRLVKPQAKFAHHHPEDKLQPLAYARFIRLLRPLAYSNEVGESFRHVYPRVIPVAYALTFGYVAMDTYHKVMTAPPQEREKKLVDTLCFHGAASIVLPTVAVGGVVKATLLVTRSAPGPIRMIAPMIAGMASIPFMVKPIDDLVESAMDKYVRPHIW